jgi:hypothetical protein
MLYDYHYHYNPDHAPNPEEWLGLDEQIRTHLVEKYHRANRIKLPDVQAHAVIHAVVENQIAENLEPVVRAMSRLAAEGLSRHESIHAIGATLTKYLYQLLKASADEKPAEPVYLAAVDRLTAQGWLGGKY